MTHRERFRAVLEGRQPDRLPWVPRLEIWYDYHVQRGSLPAEYRGWSLDQVRESVAAARSAREGVIAAVRLDSSVDVREEWQGDALTRHWVTPVGTVSEKFRQSAYGSDNLMRMEHMIKALPDYAVVKYIVQHTHFEPTYDDFRRYDEAIGDEGFPVCVIGDVPFHKILREYIGYNQAYLELQDHREEVEELASVLAATHAELEQIMLESPADLFVYGVHFDSQMLPPPVFDQYIVPHYRDLSRQFASRGKWLAVHQDADASLLLDSYLEAGISVADCFACWPMVPCRFEDAVERWKQSVVIWGGIPSTLLCPMAAGEAELDEHLDVVWEKASEGRVILGIADNVMPEADMARVKRIATRIGDQVPW